MPALCPSASCLRGSWGKNGARRVYVRIYLVATGWVQWSSIFARFEDVALGRRQMSLLWAGKTPIRFRLAGGQGCGVDPLFKRPQVTVFLVKTQVVDETSIKAVAAIGVLHARLGANNAGG